MPDETTEKTSYIEIIAFNTRTQEAEYVGSVDQKKLDGLKTMLAEPLY